jgi:hypothetical protein
MERAVDPVPIQLQIPACSLHLLAVRLENM